MDAATGEREWAFTEPSEDVDSSPTVVSGTVYVGSDDGTLYAVDGATGDREWAFTEPSDSVYSSPTVASGTVYVGSRDGTLYAVDSETGGQKWAFTEPSDGVRSSPTVASGTVYVGSNDGTLYAVDVTTGEREWTFTAEYRDVSTISSSPTVVDGVVIVGTYVETNREHTHAGAVYAVDAATGQKAWAFGNPGGSVGSSPTVVDGTVFVGGVAPGSGSTEGGAPTDGAVYALDAGVDGSSDGSRVRLGTLGHHDVAAET